MGALASSRFVRWVCGGAPPPAARQPQVLDLKVLALLQGRLWSAASDLNAQLDAGPRRESVERQLGAVWRALESIDAGRYGRCDRCGIVLDPDRLLRAPAQIHCTVCDAWS